VFVCKNEGNQTHFFAADILEKFPWAITIAPQNISASERFRGTVCATYDSSVIECDNQSTLNRCVQGDALPRFKTDQTNLGLIGLKLKLFGIS
jgi:hypothetical protein